jgi:hypothetical protein
VADAVPRNQSLGLSLPGSREKNRESLRKLRVLALWLAENAADCEDMLVLPFQN